MNKKKLKKRYNIKIVDPSSVDYALMNHTQIINTKADEPNKKQNENRWSIKDLKTKKYFKSNIKTKSQRNHSSVYE